MISTVDIQKLISSREFDTGKLSKLLTTIKSQNRMQAMNKIFPKKEYDNEKQLQAAAMFEPSGILPGRAGGDIDTTTLPSGVYVSGAVSEFAEEYIFDRRDLMNAYDPSDLGKLSGIKNLTQMAMNSGKARADNTMEYLATRIPIRGNFVDTKAGTIDYNLDDTLRIELANDSTTDYTYAANLPSGVAWTPDAKWNNSSSNPMHDLQKMNEVAGDLWGANVMGYLIPADVRSYLLNNDKFLNLVSPRAGANFGSISTMAQQFGIPELVEYNSRYTVRTRMTTAAASSATTIVVEDFSRLEAGDTIVFYKPDSQRVVGSTDVTATPSTSSVSVSALPTSLSVDTIIEVNKRFIPAGYIIGYTDRTAFQEFAMIKVPETNSGYYVIPDAGTKKNNISYSVTVGFNGRPVVWLPGGFFAVKVY